MASPKLHPCDPSLRLRLQKRKPASLHRLLTRFDPQAAERIHPNDLQKLIRALEVCLLSKAPMTSLQQREAEPLKGFRVFAVALDPPAVQLATRIDQRCAGMFENGLVEEVEGLLAMGYTASTKAFEAIGYRETLRYLAGELPLDEAIRLTQASTRQYAKRQRTWFRREAGLNFFTAFGNDPATREAAKRHVESLL